MQDHSATTRVRSFARKLREHDRRWISRHVATIVFLVSVTPAAAGPITVPTSLSSGDQYRLAFVTNYGRTATSSNIDDYNDFVTDAANDVPELLALGATWRAIASTATVDARDNTSTVPSSVTGGSLGVPIFLLNDVKLVDSYDDLWDGDIDQFLNITETVVSLGGDVRVWTGSTESGIGFGGNELGASPYSVRTGNASYRDDEWISQTAFGPNSTWRLYSLSDVLTVNGSAIPEPSSLVLAAIVGTAGLVWYRVRRRKQRKIGAIGRAAD